MVNAPLKLKEVIYEITDQCRQNCSYCGSKDILNKTPIDSDKIKRIVDNIASFPPERIDISGGNPLLVPKETHMYLAEKLKAKGVECKILFNPFNLNDDSDLILAIYDWIGVSINTKRELEHFKKKSISSWKNITIITNFNTSNLFLFKEINELVLQNNMMWQIQFTMYKDNDELAVYANEEALTYLYDQIAHTRANIVLADNMNSGESCSAGVQSLGILADGSVIPCLSERSWNSEIEVQGNLLADPISEIWMYGFIEERFNEHKCCKDVTNCCKRNDKPIKLKSPIIDTIKEWKPEKRDWSDTVMSYGVVTPSSISYPLDLQTITCVYAVQSKPYNTDLRSVLVTSTTDSTTYMKLDDFKKSE